MKTNEISAIATQVILDSISDGVFTVDHDFRIMSFNRSAELITGIPKQEAIGRKCSEVFQSNMCNTDCSLRKTMLEKKDFISSSTFITTRNGKVIPISVATSLLKDKRGKILGGVETFRDMSVIEELRNELIGMVEIGKMVTRNAEMKKIFSTLQQISQSDSNILIEGETGTGKELLAKAIHSYSARSNADFRGINCGALPDNLLESELFGYKAGAFTDAAKDKKGLLEMAGDGTLLLDEIGDTSTSFQVKLLRVLQEKEILPLGSVTPVPCKVRIITATNKDLLHMVEQNTFRRDLYYRINIAHIRLPPLRKRSEDIPLLLDTFVKRFNSSKGKRLTGFDKTSLEILLSHTYPGNVRELENIVEHCFILCDEGPIRAEHLPSFIRQNGRNSPNYESVYSENELLPRHRIEKELIVNTLVKNSYNRKKTANDLRMHKSTLYRKIKKLKIRLPQLDGRNTQ